MLPSDSIVECWTFLLQAVLLVLSSARQVQPPCISIPFPHSLFSTALPACFGPSSPYRHESHAASTHLETNDNWSPAFFVEAVPDASCDTNDQGKCYPYRFSSQPSIPPSLPKFNKRLPALAFGDLYFKLPDFGKWHAPGLH